MPANRGITIDFGLDTTSFSRGMASIRSESNKLQGELKQVNNALKLDPNNATLIAQKQVLLRQAIEETQSALTKMKEAQARADAQMENGVQVNQEEYRRLQREIIATQRTIDGLEQESRDFANAGTSSSNNFLESLSKYDGAANKAAKGLAVLGAAIFGAYKSSEELNVQISKLEANASASSADMGATMQQLNQIAALNGDIGASVEGLSNLFAANLKDTDQMQAVINSLSGAIIKFPDTMKIESLADSLQETIATGAATGQFSELLGRMGLNVDDFNQKLSTCTTEAQRQEVALEWLAKTGLAQVNEEYRKNNSTILENKEANLELQQAIAQVGLAATPVITQITQGLSGVISLCADNTGVVIGLAGAVGAFVVVVKSATIATNLYNAALAANPYALVAAGLTVLTAAAAGYILTADTAGNRTRDLYNEMKNLQQAEENQIAKSEQNVALLKQKAMRYDELRQATNRTAAQELELKDIAQELQKVLPAGTSLIDQQTGAYNALGSEIREVIKQMRIQAKLDAGKEGYSTALANMDGVKDDIDALNNEYVAMQTNAVKNPMFTALAIAKKAELDKALELYSDYDATIKDYEKLVEDSYTEQEASTQKHVNNQGDYMRQEGERKVTEAETAFGEELKVIERAHNRGEISDKKYYDEKYNLLKKHNKLELEEYDSFVGSKKSAEENANKELLKEQESANKEAIKLEKEKTKELEKEQNTQVKKAQETIKKTVDDTKSAFTALESAQKSFEDKLGSSALFTKETKEVKETGNTDDPARGTYNPVQFRAQMEQDNLQKDTKKTAEEFKLTNFKDKTEELNRYGSMLKDLQKFDGSEGLIDEIRGMDVSDAIKTMNEIKQNDPKQFIADFNEYKAAANSIATDTYNDSLTSLKNDFCDKVKTQFDDLQAGLNQSGKDSAKTYVDGLLAGLEEVGFDTSAINLSSMTAAKTSQKTAKQGDTKNTTVNNNIEVNQTFNTNDTKVQSADEAYKASKKAAELINVGG